LTEQETREQVFDGRALGADGFFSFQWLGLEPMLPKLGADILSQVGIAP
jgi:hypothetical protein